MPKSNFLSLYRRLVASDRTPVGGWARLAESLDVEAVYDTTDWSLLPDYALASTDCEVRALRYASVEAVAS